MSNETERFASSPEAVVEEFSPMGRSAKFGQPLAWKADPRLRFIFRGYGHRGKVIAHVCTPVPGYAPSDVIARQRDFLRVTETQRSPQGAPAK